MKTVALGLGVVLCACFSVPAAAQDEQKPIETIPVQGGEAADSTGSAPAMSYTNAELNYVHTDFSDFDLGADGFGVGGSFLVLPSLFVVGSYDQEKTDDQPSGPMEFTYFTLGAGYRFALTPSVDLIGMGRAVQMEAKQGSNSDDSTGYQVSVGGRALVTDQIEVAGEIAYTDVDLVIFEDPDVAVNLSGLYHIIPLVSVGLNFGIGDKYDEGSNTYGATVRFNF